MRNYMAIMHDRIKELRSRRGMTLAQIADALGTTEATAQRYESGKGIKSIPYEVIEKYANIFGCKPQYIMGWSEEIEKNPVGMAEKHVEMILDEDISEIFDDFKNFDKQKRKIVKNLVKSLAETEA